MNGEKKKSISLQTATVYKSTSWFNFESLASFPSAMRDYRYKQHFCSRCVLTFHFTSQRFRSVTLSSLFLALSRVQGYKVWKVWIMVDYMFSRLGIPLNSNVGFETCLIYIITWCFLCTITPVNHGTK